MRIKKYYCKHCGQFRNSLQVYDYNAGVFYTIHVIKCKYCDKEVIETEPEFKKWLEVQLEGKK